MAINIEALYTQYGPMVLRRCRTLLKDENRALDAMQEVFVKVLEKKNVLDATAPSSLLYTIATNHCLNCIRDDKRRNVSFISESIDDVRDGSDLEHNVLDSILLDTIFEAEEVSTKTMAILHYVDRLTLEETAACMHMSVSGIRKRLRRLRTRGLVIREG